MMRERIKQGLGAGRVGLHAGVLLAGVGIGVANAQPWYQPFPAGYGPGPYPPVYPTPYAFAPYHAEGMFPQWYVQGRFDRLGGYYFHLRIRGTPRQFYNLWQLYTGNQPGYR
jgi:hypothetical protein